MNIFDKLKLPFAKKVKQVPVSWVEEGPEHYYVIHHLLFGYSDSTSVPNGYADIFSDAEVLLYFPGLYRYCLFIQSPQRIGVMHMTDTERSMITLQELLRSTSVTVDQYKEAIYFCVATDTSQVDESKKESYCDACVTALIHLMKYTAPSTDDPKAFCLDLIQLQLTLHLTLYPNFVSSKFVIACAALAELYPLSAKEFAKPVLQMAEKFHSFNTFDLKQIGFGRRRQVSDLPKCLQDLCLFFYSEISVYWSLAVTAESNAERQLIARAAIKKASTLAYLPCHADIDLKLLDLIHIAYTDGIQKSDLYRYDSQTFNIIISGETGELLCKYDES